MTTNTVTARRKGDPQHLLREKVVALRRMARTKLHNEVMATWSFVFEDEVFRYFFYFIPFGGICRFVFRTEESKLVCAAPRKNGNTFIYISGISKQWPEILYNRKVYKDYIEKYLMTIYVWANLLFGYFQSGHDRTSFSGSAK